MVHTQAAISSRPWPSARRKCVNGSSRFIFLSASMTVSKSLVIWSTSKSPLEMRSSVLPNSLSSCPVIFIWYIILCTLSDVAKSLSPRRLVISCLILFIAFVGTKSTNVDIQWFELYVFENLLVDWLYSRPNLLLSSTISSS